MAESSEKYLQQETMVDDSSSVINSSSNLHQMEDDKQQPELVKLSASGTAEDPMLGFLTLLAKVERPACANCESKDLSPMFFCNTCSKSIHLLVFCRLQ
jgi:hypothetical protein